MSHTATSYVYFLGGWVGWRGFSLSARVSTSETDGTYRSLLEEPGAIDAPVDSSSERGTKSEHTGTGFARNNTGPSTQHLDGGGSEGHSSPTDPFVYDLYQGPLDLGGWSCTDDDMDEYLDVLARSTGEPPVGDAGINAGPDYHV